MWTGKLRGLYESFKEFKAFSSMYGLSKRLGFSSAKKAWDANPMIQGSTNPSDYKIVTPKKKRSFKEEFLSEKINYGGMAATRQEAFDHALEACKRPGISPARVKQAADLFAFGPNTKALTEKEASKLIPFKA